MSICNVGMKMLVPLDGSIHAARALETAVSMAKKFAGTITLVHVVAPFPTLSLPIPENVFAVAGEAATKSGEQLLATTKKRLRAEGVTVESSLKIGHAVGEIIKISKEGKFDLIVIGAKGVSNIEELVLGSVSHGVIKHATLPVLVVRASGD